MATPAEMVANIDVAIAACIAGFGAAQTINMGGRSVTFSLAALQALREHYLKLDTSGTDTRSYANFEGTTDE